MSDLETIFAELRNGSRGFVSLPQEAKRFGTTSALLKADALRRGFKVEIHGKYGNCAIRAEKLSVFTVFDCNNKLIASYYAANPGEALDKLYTDFDFKAMQRGAPYRARIE